MTLTSFRSNESAIHRPKAVAMAAVVALGALSAPAVFAQASSVSPVIKAGPVDLTFGGFIELATIYRNRNQTADMGSDFSTGIPFPNSTNYNISEFRMSARQSRLSLLAQGEPFAGAKAEAYFEMDFLSSGTTSNSRESNSYTLRMRNIYGRWIQDSGLQLLFGQNWSLSTLYKKGLSARDENVPSTIDAQYVVGFNWLRVPQVRLVQTFDKFSLGLSIESPQAVINTQTNVPASVTIGGASVTLSPYPPNTVVNSAAGGSLLNSTTSYSNDVAPDVILKAALDPGFGHYEVYGLGRWFRSTIGTDNETVNGGGVGAGFILPVVANKLTFQASGLYGKGIGRYGSAQLPDVTVKPNGTFATIKQYSALVGLTFVPTPPLSIYVYGGREKADPTDFTGTIATHGVTLGPYAYGYGSPLYNNSGCYTLGGTCVGNTQSVDEVTAGFWWKYYQGVLGNLQFGLQAAYFQRNAFNGVGGAPSTNMFVGMASFRYYPYQK
jgi:hypothetical protein